MTKSNHGVEVLGMEGRCVCWKKIKERVRVVGGRRLGVMWEWLSVSWYLVQIQWF